MLARFLSAQPLALNWRGFRFAPPLWAYAVTVLTMLLLFLMGHWQLQRASYKEGLFSRHEQRQDLVPLTLAELDALLAHQADAQDYPLRVQGRYDNPHTILLDNQMRAGVAGYHVLTLFRPEVGARALLVDRGWVAAGRDRRQLPELPAALAEELRGRLALPVAPLRVAAEDYQARPLRLIQLDMAELSQVLGVPLYPFLVRLDEQAADGFVREWAPASRIRMGPEKHRAYAFQWFSLMSAVGLIFLAVNWRRIKPTK